MATSAEADAGCVEETPTERQISVSLRRLGGESLGSLTIDSSALGRDLALKAHMLLGEPAGIVTLVNGTEMLKCDVAVGMQNIEGAVLECLLMASINASFEHCMEQNGDMIDFEVSPGGDRQDLQDMHDEGEKGFESYSESITDKSLTTMTGDALFELFHGRTSSVSQNEGRVAIDAFRAEEPELFAEVELLVAGAGEVAVFKRCVNRVSDCRKSQIVAVVAGHTVQWEHTVSF